MREIRSERVLGRSVLGTALAIVVGMTCAVGLGRWLDANRADLKVSQEDEAFYLQGSTLKRFSMGSNGLIADWYWMRSLQYVGRKIIAYDRPLQLDDLGALNLKLLAPLLDQTTTIDPQFLPAYEYGAMLLPAVDSEAAIKLLSKGIGENHSAWILYHHLGYIYWQRGNFVEAARLYEKGAGLPGAPAWMEAMAARMTAEGGSRSTAREIYQRIFQQSDDENIRKMAQSRLMQLQFFDDRDAIRNFIQAFSSRYGRCPASWKETSGALKSFGLAIDPQTYAPIDPAGFAYVLAGNGCDVELDPKSVVPPK